MPRPPATAAMAVAGAGTAPLVNGRPARWRSDNNACMASEFEVLTSYVGNPTLPASADFSIVIP